MRRLYLTAACGLLAAAVLRAAPITARSSAPRDRLLIAEAAVRVEQKVTTASLYTTHCEACHGPKGVAPAPEMSFKGRKWKQGTSSAAMAKVIRDGIEATAMMPFNQKLSAAEISALAKLVRSFDPALKPERVRPGSN